LKKFPKIPAKWSAREAFLVNQERKTEVERFTVKASPMCKLPMREFWAAGIRW